MDCWPLVNISFPDNWRYVCIGIRPSGCWLVHYNLLLNNICNDSLLRLWRMSNVIRRGPLLREFRRGKWMLYWLLLSASADMINHITLAPAFMWLSQQSLRNFHSGLLFINKLRVALFVFTDVRARIVTWLILPVVICLSQRLSHACLSINKFILWNCEWLIKSVIVYLIVPYYLDNRGNSRANTC